MEMIFLMKSSQKPGPVKLRVARGAWLSLLLLTIPATTFTSSTDDKIKPEQLVAKHLESIGSSEARASLKSLIIKGTSLATLRVGGRGQAEGQALMASEGSMNLISMTFPSAAYPSESLAFDGKKLTASHLRPGVPTRLAQFLLPDDEVFKEGLIGGTLSASWPFLNITERNPKLEYGGIKKVGDKQQHALKYTPRKGSDLKITLFFSAETFQHVRTEYERVITASLPQLIVDRPQSDQDRRRRDASVKIVEEFSDFRIEGKLNLPHTYKIELFFQSETNPLLVDWLLNLTDFSFNQSLDARQFSIGK
jgi:hypothetical protein